MSKKNDHVKKLFGTDGVRGIANVEPMTAETALQLGRAVAYIFKNDKPRRHQIIIGKDTRLSCYMFENALTAGICSMGVDALLIGPLPTPGIAFITRSMRADAGAVISASHNPFQDNGIKFFCREGFKLPDDVEERIEAAIASGEINEVRPIAHDVGRAFRIDDARGRYIVFLKNSFPDDQSLEELRIVLDCANGAAYRVAPTVMRELGAEVLVTGKEPNGENINLNCGALHPSNVCAKVKKYRADIGIALDGDGDRAILSDENGNEVDGDVVMAICAQDMMERGVLKNNTLVATVMSNLGLEIAIRKMGATLVRSDVGDRYVVEEMRKLDANLGGEQSGHIIFLDHNTTGDGIITALQVMAIMTRKQKSLSELAKVMKRMPQVLKNVRVKEKREFSDIPEIESKIRDAEEKLGDAGRIFVRYSGTEPLARVMVEGTDEGDIRVHAFEVADAIRRMLG